MLNPAAPCTVALTVSWPSPDFLKILLESCGGGEKGKKLKKVTRLFGYKADKSCLIYKFWILEVR